MSRFRFRIGWEEHLASDVESNRLVFEGRVENGGVEIVLRHQAAFAKRPRCQELGNRDRRANLARATGLCVSRIRPTNSSENWSGSVPVPVSPGRCCSLWRSAMGVRPRWGSEDVEWIRRHQFPDENLTGVVVGFQMTLSNYMNRSADLRDAMVVLRTGRHADLSFAAYAAAALCSSVASPFTVYGMFSAAEASMWFGDECRSVRQYNTQMATHPDVLIVGGGVIGLSTAYFLTAPVGRSRCSTGAIWVRKHRGLRGHHSTRQPGACPDRL